MGDRQPASQCQFNTREPMRMPNIVFSEMSGNDVPLGNGQQAQKYFMTHKRLDRSSFQNQLLCNNSDSLEFTLYKTALQGVSLMIQTFRYDGEGHMYQFELKNPSLEMAPSQVISQNSFLQVAGNITEVRVGN